MIYVFVLLMWWWFGVFYLRARVKVWAEDFLVEVQAVRWLLRLYVVGRIEIFVGLILFST